jgi:MFS family permease
MSATAPGSADAGPGGAGARGRFGEPLRNPTFTLLVSGQIVSQVGDAAFRIALIVWVVQTTGSAAALGVITGAFMVTNLLTFFVSGVVVDRFPRRTVMIGSDVARTLLAAAFAVVATGSAPTAVIAVLYGCFGISDAFFLPAYRANLPQILPAWQLYPANALDMMGRRAGLILGPLLGAVLVHAGGASVAFWADALSFAVSVATLVMIGARARRGAGVPAAAASAADVADDGDAATQPPVAASGARALLREAAVGVRYLWAVRWLGLLTVTAAVANAGAAGSMDVVLPFGVREWFGQGSPVLGACYAVQAAGALAGAFAVGRFRTGRPAVAMAAFMVVTGLSVAGLAATRSVLPILALGVCYGMAIEASGVHWNTLVQLHVPEQVLGRVSAADYLVSYSLMPLAVAACGITLPALGVSRAFAVIGLVMVAASAAPLLSRTVRALTANAAAPGGGPPGG